VKENKIVGGRRDFIDENDFWLLFSKAEGEKIMGRVTQGSFDWRIRAVACKCVYAEEKRKITKLYAKTKKVEKGKK
jgi:hypothetical protein